MQTLTRCGFHTYSCIQMVHIHEITDITLAFKTARSVF